MAEPRRVRTQAERASEAWRAAAASRPGFVTYPGTAAGDPSWWPRRRDSYLRLSPVARVMAYPDGPPPVDGETCKQWCGYCHLGSEPEQVPTQSELLAAAVQPREPGVCTSRQPWICTPADCPGCANDHCWVQDPTGCRYGCDVRPRPVRKPPPDTSWLRTTQPRRRWWHRLIRRNP